MFDVGFSEILVIAVVALLVLGPERLPKAARFAGLWMRRARAQWNSVKAELENEIADEELRRNLREAREQVRETMQSTRALIDPASSDAMPQALSAATTDNDPQPAMTALPRNTSDPDRIPARPPAAGAAAETPASDRPSLDG
jgi:sec-independent protein translocase protein TatB